MPTVLSLAWAGLRHRRSPWLLLALGVAVAVVLPVFAAGLRAEANTAAVSRAVDDLPVASRSVLGVTSQDLRTRSWSAIDSTVRRAFRDVGATDVQLSVTFRPLSVGGQDVTIGALDRLGAGVRLSSGDLPRRCAPTACDVLAVVSPGADPPHLPAAALRSLGLEVTGVAVAEDDRLAGAGLVPPDLPMLLGADPHQLARLEALTLFQRNTAWLGALDGPTVAVHGGPETTRRLAGLAADVSAQSAPLIVRWPADEVAAAAARADASADRFAVLGAGAACLQLGFSVAVAAGLRRRLVLVARLLTRRGAGPAMITAVATIQSTLAVLAGTVVGLLAGVGALMARGTDVDGAGAAVAAAMPTSAGVVVVTVGLAVLVLRWSGSAAAAAWLLTTLLVGAVALSLVLVRTGTDPGPAAAAVLALLVTAGLLAGRLWTPVAALTARAAGRAPWAPRSTALAATAVRVAHRRPLLRMVVAGVLASACATTLFAVGYRTTLQQSAADQAASRVPLDVAVAPSAQVAAPLTVLDPAGVESAVPGAEVHPIISAAVSAFAGSPLATSLPLIGIDRSTLHGMHAFASTTGAEIGAAELGTELTPGPSGSRPAVVRLASKTREVTTRVDGLTSDVVLDLWLAGPYGGERAVRFHRAGPAYRAVIPAGGPWTVTAVEVTESASFSMHRQHGVGEGSTDRAVAAGTLRIAPVETAGRPAASGWSWTGWNSDQAEVTVARTGSLQVRYRIEDRRVVVVPGLFDASTQTPLPVAVDPATAARAEQAGRLTLSVNGRSVPARIVAVLPRFPRFGDEFVLADRSAVTAVLDGSAPGTAAVTQLWISAPPGSVDRLQALLTGSPAARASLTWRAEVQRVVATDPIATRSVLLLSVAGALTLALGLIALATAVRADADETAADAYALELDGVPPHGLRTMLAIRAALVIAVGLPLGLFGGWLAGRVGVALLLVGPGGAAVVPPLHYVLPVQGTVAVVTGMLVGAVAVAAATVAGSYRSARPEAPEVDLR